MKSINIPSPIRITLLSTLLSLHLAFSLHAQSSAEVEVKALLGSATYSLSGGNATALTVGTRLGDGAQIKTGPRSAIDLSFGKVGGIIRLTENATLNIQQIGATNNAAQIQVHLAEGTLLGKSEKLPSGSIYEIKVANGIVGIGPGTQFRSHADGYQVLVEGTLIFVHVPANAEPKAHPMKTPGPVYFSPDEGVRVAPSALVKEIKNQMKVKLPVR